MKTLNALTLLLAAAALAPAAPGGNKPAGSCKDLTISWEFDDTVSNRTFGSFNGDRYPGTGFVCLGGDAVMQANGNSPRRVYLDFREVLASNFGPPASLYEPFGEAFLNVRELFGMAKSFDQTQPYTFTTRMMG